jgi:hypothetical protein
MRLDETLLAGDLEHLVSHIFEIDSFKSKIGGDGEMVVLSFTIDEKAPADDLARFLEMGYDYVIDADATNGPLENGKHKVFVEVKRSRYIAKQIYDILDGVSRLTKIDNFKFRYYKSFKSIPATMENLEEFVPIDQNGYEDRINSNRLNNFSNFFNKSFVENIDVLEDDIIFKKIYAESVKMKIKDFGLRENVYQNIPGKLDIDSQSTSEILYLTKVLGNYNITKINNTFIFENEGHAVALEKL